MIFRQYSVYINGTFTCLYCCGKEPVCVCKLLCWWNKCVHKQVIVPSIIVMATLIGYCFAYCVSKSHTGKLSVSLAKTKIRSANIELHVKWTIQIFSQKYFWLYKETFQNTHRNIIFEMVVCVKFLHSQSCTTFLTTHRTIAFLTASDFTEYQNQSRFRH